MLEEGNYAHNWRGKTNSGVTKHNLATKIAGIMGDRSSAKPKATTDEDLDYSYGSVGGEGIDGVDQEKKARPTISLLDDDSNDNVAALVIARTELVKKKSIEIDDNRNVASLTHENASLEHRNYKVKKLFSVRKEHASWSDKTICVCTQNYRTSWQLLPKMDSDISD
eukprot:IDg6458t1